MDDPSYAPPHAPHLVYHLPYAAPAAPAPAPPSLASDLRGSGVRMFVAFVSLASGQIILGEPDPARVVRRAAVGATMTELAGSLVRWAQQEAPLDAPLDVTILASYGPRELEAIERVVRTARLGNRQGG